MKAYCRDCKKELEVNGREVGECECNGGFVAGTKGLSIVDNKITCNCDSPAFSLKMHMNMEPRHYYEYECKCGNVIVLN